MTYTVAPVRGCNHIGCMTRLTDAVRVAVQRAPGSLRTLARAARVPHSTLSQIMHGHREATEDVARKVAIALGRWSQDTRRAADRIRRTLTPDRR
jgi:transcriptional regulator with XRE-family HTH domain